MMVQDFPLFAWIQLKNQPKPRENETIKPVIKLQANFTSDIIPTGVSELQYKFMLLLKKYDLWNFFSCVALIRFMSFYDRKEEG